MNWSFDPILNSYLVVGLLGLGLVLSLLVGPIFRNLSVTQRRTLRVLRGLLVVLILLLMLRPTHVSTRPQPQSASLLILFDQSRSMQLPNATEDRSRWEAQAATLQSAVPLLDELESVLEVKVLPYDGTLQSSVWQDRQLNLPDAPEGDETDIGTSLYQAVRQEQGKRLVGVVLLGDGTQTAAQPDVEIYEAARELGHLGYPLYTIAYGPSSDSVQSRDVAVENLPEQYTVFVKNELVVHGLVRVRGYVNQQIPITMVIENDAGEKETIGPVIVQADKDNQQLDVQLTYVPQTPGQYRLTFQAEPQPGELVNRNNQLTAFLTVREGGLKVLYLEGEPRLEQKFIRWALESSPEIDLDFQWFPQRLRGAWPVDLAGVFDQSDYDVFLLGDCDRDALGEANLKQLAAAVEAGQGLIALGGYHSFGPGGYRTSPLAEVLPVTMDRFARQSFDEPLQSSWHVPGPLQMRPSRPHPVTMLAPPDENEEAWRRLRPLTGANRWSAVRQSPSVRLLAEAQDGTPLLVAGEYGRGRVLAFAGDSTWQWWRQGMKAKHTRFWRQIVLWLAQRDDLTRTDVWIDLAQRRLPKGSQVTFTTGARSATGDVIPSTQLEATYVDRLGESRTIRLARDGDHWVGTIDRVDQPGSCEIRVMATDVSGQLVGIAKAQFEITDQNVELASPAADPDQMIRLANLTRDAGGRVLAPEQLPDLLEEIKANPPKLVEQVLTKWQLTDTSLDAWLMLLAIVGLLSAEWILRKRWGLV
jgi:hypothetical protein